MKLLIFLLAILLVIVQIQLWFGTYGIFYSFHLKREVSAQIKENKALEKRNKKLEKNVVLLKNGKAMVESLAREKMGMIKPGERYYQFVKTNSLGAGDNKG